MYIFWNFFTNGFELEKSIGQVDLLCIPSRSWCRNLRIRFAGPLPRDIGVRYLYVVGLTAVPGQLSVRWYNSEVNPGDYSKEIPESGKQMSQPFSRHRCILWALTLFSLILSSIMTIFILVVSLTDGSLWWRSSRCSLTLLSFSSCLFAVCLISHRVQDCVQEGITVRCSGRLVTD